MQSISLYVLGTLAIPGRRPSRRQSNWIILYSLRWGDHHCHGGPPVAVSSVCRNMPDCCKTRSLELVRNLLLAGQIKPSCPRLWTCVDTGQYFAVLESHSVINQGLEHLKDTACLHWTLSRCGIKHFVSAHSVLIICWENKNITHTRQSTTHNKPCNRQSLRVQ